MTRQRGRALCLQRAAVWTESAPGGGLGTTRPTLRFRPILQKPTPDRRNWKRPDRRTEGGDQRRAAEGPWMGAAAGSTKNHSESAVGTKTRFRFEAKGLAAVKRRFAGIEAHRRKKCALPKNFVANSYAWYHFLTMADPSAPKLEELLKEALTEIQQLSGEEDAPIDYETCPITDLPGFDSLRGVEATCLVSAKLGKEIPTTDGQVNIFVSKDGKRALKVFEIVTRIASLMEQ